MADPYLTPEQIRLRVGSGAAQLPGLGTDGDALIADWIAEFEQIAEEYRGVAFTARESTITQSVPAGGVIFLPALTQSIDGFTVDGDTVDVGNYTFDKPGGILTYRIRCWTPAEMDLTVTHGFDAPSALVKRACHQYVLAVARAENAGTSRDVIAQSFDGGITRYSTPDWDNGRPTGFLEVDRLLNSLPWFPVVA